MKSPLRVRGLVLLLAVGLGGTGVSAALSRGPVYRRRTGVESLRGVKVRLQPRVVDYGAARVSVSGITAASMVVRLSGATDMRGVAYHWAPYRWRRLHLLRGTWHGVLPAPALRGIYQLQFRVPSRKRLLQSAMWLLRVLPRGTLRHPAFATPRAAVRNFVSHLRGHQVLVAIRRFPPPVYDHRDPRLHRIFVIAYAPRGDPRPASRRGLFIEIFRNGFNGHWRLLQACTGPCT